MPVKRRRQQEEARAAKTAPAKKGGIYDTHYKQLLIIPFLILILAIASIAVQTARTGDFINRGVSLKGGLQVTIPSSDADADDLAEQLRATFPEIDIESRDLEEAGTQVAITISADVVTEDDELVDRFLQAVEKASGVRQEEFSVETIGSTLGATFFQQTTKALSIAFLFMGMVVFLYFGDQNKIKVITTVATVTAAALMYSPSRTLNIIAGVIGAGLIVTYARYSIPSVAVILAAFSDIVITLAVTNILGIKVGTAGIAAFLMLIGYSVDTDILLSTRVLKRTEGTVYDRIVGTVKTGLTMNLTTMAAVIVALIFAESEVIAQIMTILLIGLFADMINTWLQNTGILRWYLERKERKEQKGVRG